MSFFKDNSLYSSSTNSIPQAPTVLSPVQGFVLNPDDLISTNWIPSQDPTDRMSVDVVVTNSSNGAHQNYNLSGYSFPETGHVNLNAIRSTGIIVQQPINLLTRITFTRKHYGNVDSKIRGHFDSRSTTEVVGYAKF